MNAAALWQLAWVELKLNARSPELIFWVIAFPVLWMGLFGAIFNEEVEYFNVSLNQANFLLPGAIGVVICASAFIGMSSTLATYRETGVLKRLRVTPLTIPTLALAFTLSQALFITAGILMLFLVGKLAFDVKVLGSWPVLIAVCAFGMATFLALGAAIGSVAKSARAATIITLMIFMPMIFLSELWMPISLFPSWLQPICQALPLTPLVTLLRDTVFGVAMGDYWRFGLLAGWLVVGSVITVRFFRWQ
ncbi:MAG: ABC transporter permease [Chloroflexota bacterium]|nr:ABC transporter permease [Chloroflexota bacterium]